KPKKFGTLSFAKTNVLITLAALRRRVSLSQQLQRLLKLCSLAAVLAAIAITAAALALGCRGEHSCCGGSTAQPRAARSDVTWLLSTTADEGLASGASEVRVGGRSQCPSVVMVSRWPNFFEMGGDPGRAPVYRPDLVPRTSWGSRGV
ncbi:hypothetical protein TYRP_007103, partial [Tyrophagus putrescentiae]